MGMHQSAARLSERDIADLEISSQRLAAAAGAIRRANPTWGEAVVQSLIEVNNVVVRIQEKGARAFARYLERHGTKKPQDAPASSPAAEISPSSPIAAPGEEET